MRELTPPEKLLAEINSAFPAIWRAADLMRSERGAALPDWHKGVFLPMHLWRVIMTNFGKADSLSSEEIAFMQVCSFIGAWRPSQDVVRFDPDLYASLLETPLSGNLPSDVLWRLPAWAIYVEAPTLSIDGRDCEGFIAMLNESPENERRELRIFFMGENGSPRHEILNLGPWGLQEAMDPLRPGPGLAWQAEAPASTRKVYPALQSAVSLLLYLCAYGFQEGIQHSPNSPAYPAPRRVKNGWRLFPPDRPKIHAVGREIGDALRKMRQSGHVSTGAGRKSPRPHLRRAHWHGFWSGPRKDSEKRKFDLAWLPPMPVAMGEDEQVAQ